MRTGTELVADLKAKLGQPTAFNRGLVDSYYWGTDGSGAAVRGGPVAKLEVDPHGFGDLRVGAGEAWAAEMSAAAPSQQVQQVRSHAHSHL